MKIGCPETAEAMIAVRVGSGSQQDALFEETDLGPEFDARGKSLPPVAFAGRRMARPGENQSSTGDQLVDHGVVQAW